MTNRWVTAMWGAGVDRWSELQLLLFTVRLKPRPTHVDVIIIVWRHSGRLQPVIINCIPQFAAEPSSRCPHISIHQQLVFDVMQPSQSSNAVQLLQWCVQRPSICHVCSLGSLVMCGKPKFSPYSVFKNWTVQKFDSVQTVFLHAICHSNKSE